MSSIPTELTQLADELAALDGSAPADERATVPGFWASGTQPNFPPAAIADPEQWDGTPHLQVICTQTNLSARDQKRLVERWCVALPAMTSLQMLWFGSRVPQALFEAACRLPGLEGLYLKWNGIKDLSAILELRHLRYLHLGASSSVVSLDPLGELSGLEWLQIESPTKAFALEPLQGLLTLVGLGFLGVEGKKYSVPSLSPLSSLVNLRWLHLGAVHVSDDSLRPLAALRHLEWLGIGNFFSVQELAWLSTRLTATKCDWLKPFCRYHRSVFPCGTCKENWRVLTSGKGSRLLCPSCDSLKLARHVQAFEAAVDEARRDMR